MLGQHHLRLLFFWSLVPRIYGKRRSASNPKTGSLHIFVNELKVAIKNMSQFCLRLWANKSFLSILLLKKIVHISYILKCQPSPRLNRSRGSLLAKEGLARPWLTLTTDMYWSIEIYCRSFIFYASIILQLNLPKEYVEKYCEKLKSKGPRKPAEHEDPTTVVNESLRDHEVKLFVTIYVQN